MERKSRKILSLFLVLIMIIGMISANILAQETRKPYANTVIQESASLDDYIFIGDEKLDWDEEEVQSTDTHWPLLEGQRLRRVGRLEPINGFDLNYVGQYTDGEGRDVIRVEVKHFQNTAADGIFQNLQLRFDPELDKLVDWTRSGFITVEGNFVDINKAKDKNNAVNIDYPTIRAGYGANQQIYHMPLDIVLKEGRKLSELKVDTYVQARLVTSDNKQIMTRAYGDIQPDYSRYTYMAGIPIGETRDTFRLGEFKTRGTGSNFSYLYNKTANLSVEYSDVRESGLNTGAKIYNGLTFQYHTIAEDVSNLLLGNNYKFALMLSFDQDLADLLKGTSANEKVGEVILFGGNGRIKTRNHVPLEIQKQNINKDEKTGRSFIVIKPDDSNFELPGINSINVSKRQWTTHVLDTGRNFLRIRLLVDQNKIEEYVNSPKGNSAGSKFLNVNAKMGFVVENPIGWTDFKSTVTKDMSFGNQAFFITEVSEPLHGARNVNQRNNQIQYKLGSGPNQMVETVQGHFFGANDNEGFRNRIEGITYGGDGGRFFATNPIFHASQGKKYLHGGRTIKAGEDITVYIPNIANYGGQVKMWGVDISNSALTTGIYMEPQSDPSVIRIFNPHETIEEAIVTYKNKNNELKKDTLIVERTLTRRRWKGIDNTSGVLSTTGDSDVISSNPIIGFQVDTKNINFDQEFKIEFFQGSTPKGTITITQLPEFKRVEETYNNLTYLYNSVSEAPFMIGKAHYLPMQDMIFTDDIEFNGYSRFENARIQLDAINPSTNMNIIAFGTSGHDEYDDEGKIIERRSFGEEIIYNGKDYRVYPYRIQKPDLIGQMFKDLPLYFSNNDSSSMQSESKIERVHAKVNFDLNGGRLSIGEASYNERKNPTDPIERILPDNKYYIDPFTKVLAGEPWKALVYEEKDTDGKVSNRLVPALDTNGNQLDYIPNGFTGDNIQFINKDTGKEMTEAEKALRTMPEGIESPDPELKFIGWSTKDNITIEDWATMEEADTLEKVNDTSKAYKFTEKTPVDRNTTVYALYAEGKTIRFHTNRGYQDKVVEKTLVPDDQGRYEIPVVSGRDGLANEGFSKKEHTFAGWTKTADVEIKTASNLDSPDGRLKEIYTYNLQTEEGDATILSTKYDSISVSADELENVTDLYARYSPYITVRAEKKWEDLDTTSGASAKVGLIYRTAVGKEGQEVINEAAATYYPYKGSIENGVLKKFRKGESPIDTIEWRVPGFNEQGERLSYLAIEFDGKDDQAEEKFKNFNSNWADYGIVLHSTASGNNIAKNQVFKTKVYKKDTGESVDTFTGATRRSHTNNDNQFTGYNITVTNTLVDLGDPILDMIYDGQNHITVRVNPGKEPEEVVTEVKLPDNKTVYVKHISLSEYKVFTDKEIKTEDTNLEIEFVEEGTFKLSYKNGEKFKIGQEVSVQNFKGDVESGSMKRTVLPKLKSNAPGKPIQVPREDGSSKARFEVNIQKDHVKGPDPVFTLVNHLGEEIKNGNELIKGEYDPDNNIVVYEVPDGSLTHGQILKAVLTETDKEPGESLEGDPIDVQGPNIWEVSYQEENKRYIVTAKVDPNDIRRSDPVFIGVNESYYLAQVDKEGNLRAFLPPLDLKKDNLKVIAKDKLNNEAFSIVNQLKARADFIEFVREAKSGANSVFIKTKENNNADYRTTVEVQRQGQVIFVETKTIKPLSTFEFILKDTRGTLILEKGDIITVTPSKGQTYEGQAIVFVVK